LEQSLGLLAGGARDLPERQQTLRGAIAWSYDLLEPLERVYFRRLAVFAGGWSIADAETVCDPHGTLGIDVLDALGSLVDNSLIRRSDAGGAEARFRMLQLIREYGLERLAEAGEAEATEDRLLGVVAERARRAELELVGRESKQWLDLLETEHDNIRAALRWALAAGHVQEGLETSGRLWRFWHQRGHLREGLSMTLEFLACPEGQSRTIARATALNGAGGLAYWLNDFAAARTYYEEQRSINEELDARPGLAEAHFNLGYLAAVFAEYDDAVRHYEAALALSQELSDEVGVGGVVLGLALVQYLRGDLAAAEVTFVRGIEHARRIGDRFREASGLGARGRVALADGRLDVARADASAALRMFAESGDPTGVAMELDDLGNLAQRLGDPVRALRLAGASAAVRERIAGGAPPTLIRQEDYTPAARAALLPTDADAEFAAGMAMTEEAAVAYALERVETAGPARGGRPARSTPREDDGPDQNEAGPASGDAP
jgi:tetratricopeptide (TPR) repeat protein